MTTLDEHASRKAHAYIYDADASYQAAIREGIDDLLAGLAMHAIWVRLGWRDMLQQTHRTALGPLWTIVGTGIQVGALGYVYGALLKTAPTDTFPFIAAGLIIWFFIAASILGGLSVFPNGAGIIKETELPMSLPVYRYVFRIFVEFAYKFVVFAVVAVLVGLTPNWYLLLVVPALALYILNGVWVVTLLGVAGARYWDLREIISPLMLIAFLATPVLWHSNALADKAHLAALNPLTHYIDILREPLMGHVPSASAYELVLAVTIAGWICAVGVYGLARNRIVYWL
jgi:homopolymeric O-antigen transport system permease protein